MHIRSQIEEFKKGMAPHISETKFALRRIRKSPLSIAGAAIIIFFAFIAVLAPVLAPPVYRDPFMIWVDGAASEPRPPGSPVTKNTRAITLGYTTHIFGTAPGQYDIYYGVIWGSITAFRVGILVVAATLIIGCIIGLLAGYYGGIIDEVIMRFTDIIFAFPGLILAMALVLALPPKWTIDISLLIFSAIGYTVFALIGSKKLSSGLSLAFGFLGFALFASLHIWVLYPIDISLLIFSAIGYTVFALIGSKILKLGSDKNLAFGFLGLVLFAALDVGVLHAPHSLIIGLPLTRLDKALVAITIVGWPGYTRLLRGEVLRIKQEDYIEAAKAVGCSDLRIMFKHILPNSVYPILITASLDIGGIVLLAAALSFLNIGAPVGYADWGQMISFASNSVNIKMTYWYTFFIPGFFILLFVLGWNLLGDAFRDILDPMLRRK